MAVEAAASRRKSMSSGWILFGGISAIVLMGVGLFWLYLASSDPLSKAIRLIEEREFTEAQAILSAYVQGEPDDARAFYELGRLQWRASQFGNAAGSFTRAVQIDPNDVNAALWTVVALSRSNDAGARSRQISVLESVVESVRGDPALWYVLALTRGVAGDVQGQIKALERVIELRPTDDSARWGMGLTYALNGDYDKARGQLALVGEGPRSADALAIQGFVANLEGSPKFAAQHFEEALNTDGITVAWHAQTELGKLRMKEGQFQAAQQHFESALALRENSPLVRYLRAVCLQARTRQQEAVREFEAIARDRGAYAMEATVQTAQAYLSMDMPDRARQAIEQAGKLGGSGAPYYTIRGRVLALDRDDSGALSAYRRAIDADPRFAAAYLEKGLLHVRNDNIAGGLRDLERYLELVGSNIQGTRAADIRALAEQLRQATRGTGTTGNAATVSRRGIGSR